jgi:hypothetical protein
MAHADIGAYCCGHLKARRYVHAGRVVIGMQLCHPLLWWLQHISYSDTLERGLMGPSSITRLVMRGGFEQS